jgi:hypothetical protein
VQSLLEVVIGDDRIRVTEKHPLWVTGKGWVGAEALEPGDCVRTLAGTCQAVVSVQLVSADTWVYNLTVATAHTYFVGDGQWLVHNRCGAQGFDWDHIFSRHAEWGHIAQQSGKKGIFEGLTAEQIKARVRNAWKNRKLIKTQYNVAKDTTRQLYRGVDSVSGQTIEMWFDKTAGIVETAYPIH